MAITNTASPSYSPSQLGPSRRRLLSGIDGATMCTRSGCTALAETDQASYIMRCTPCGLLMAALLPLIPRIQGRVGRSDLSCFVLHLQHVTCMQFPHGRVGRSDLWCSVLGVQCVTCMLSVHAQIPRVYYMW